MTYPREFLSKLAADKRLSPGEREVFLAMFGQGLDHVQTAQQIGIKLGTINTRLTGVYKKFGLGNETGPVKEGLLSKMLVEEYQRDSRKHGTVDAIASPENLSSTIETLVQEARSRLRPKIEQNYSKIRLLNGEQRPIDELYVEVYLLKSLSSRRNRDVGSLFFDFDPIADRLAMTARGNREAGMAVLAMPDFKRSVILGKPGHGKSTFLQHLAIACSRGTFQADCIPVLLEFRNLDEEAIDLMRWIETELGLTAETETQELLEQGRILLLLDGLDEVPSQWQSEIQVRLRKFFKQFDQLRVVMTCRTQTTEFIPNGFECVEMAEFNQAQIKAFVEHWFPAQGSVQGAEQARRFLAALNDSKPTAELMRTPLLLSLACWVFSDRGHLPTQRLKLYDQGVDLLLARWDEERPGHGRIRRHCNHDIYKGLSLEQRKDLLSYIAFEKFANPQTLSDGKLNFILYEQPEIEQLIAQKLNRTLTDSRGIPSAIESQHGLVVAMSYKIWSFSHLTFQEYFTAREIVANSAYKQLAQHITEPRWREVFLLTAGMMTPNADALATQMKQQIDGLIADDAGM